jgi:transcriptional regulator with XRE-family HTH domain
MRKRRAQLGLTGAELAQRAGISTSYVSLIENGAKVPEEDVAAGLARALEDDEALYRGWARAMRLGLHDLALLNELEAIARTPAYVSLVESGQELPRIEADSQRGDSDASSDLTSRLKEVASRLTPLPVPAEEGTSPRVPARADVVGIPILAEGADPAVLDTAHSRFVQDRLVLDQRLVGDHDPRRLFAYEITATATQRLRGVADTGDRVVLARHGAVTPDRICAVRTGKGIILSRALVQERALLLLPGDGDVDFESIGLPDPDGLARVVAGTHVLLIRR